MDWIVEGTGARSSLEPKKQVRRLDVDPSEMAKKIKGFGVYLGASKVRITKLNQNWVYTNFAHPYTPEPYGKPVELDYENIVCIAVKQKPEMMRNGTGVAEHTEVKILKHLGLWEAKARPPPKVKAFSVTISIDDSDSQVLFSTPPIYLDPDYPMDYNRISKPRWVTPMVTVSAICSLFLIPRKSYHLIIVYSIEQSKKNGGNSITPEAP